MISPFLDAHKALKKCHNRNLNAFTVRDMFENIWEYTEIYASMWKEELHIRITFPDGEAQISPHKSLLAVINELGKDRWELVSMTARGRRAGEEDFSQILYLKRPAKPKISSGTGPLRGTR